MADSRRLRISEPWLSLPAIRSSRKAPAPGGRDGEKCERGPGEVAAEGGSEFHVQRQVVHGAGRCRQFCPTARTGRPRDGESNARQWRPAKRSGTRRWRRRLCEALAVAPRSIQWLCAENPHWPCHQTIFAWRNARPEFRNAMAQARRELADVLAFQSVEIADDSSGDGKDDRCSGTVRRSRSWIRSSRRAPSCGRSAPLATAGKLKLDVVRRADQRGYIGSARSCRPEDALDQLR